MIAEERRSICGSWKSRSRRPAQRRLAQTHRERRTERQREGYRVDSDALERHSDVIGFPGNEAMRIGRTFSPHSPPRLWRQGKRMGKLCHARTSQYKRFCVRGSRKRNVPFATVSCVMRDSGFQQTRQCRNGSSSSSLSVTAAQCPHLRGGGKRVQGKSIPLF